MAGWVRQSADTERRPASELPEYLTARYDLELLTAEDNSSAAFLTPTGGSGGKDACTLSEEGKLPSLSDLMKQEQSPKNGSARK